MILALACAASRSLAPDGTPCEAETSGLLQRARITAGEFRYVGKETDRKWEEGDDISILEFKTTEYGRARKVEPPTELKDEIAKIPLRELMRRTGMSHHTLLKARRGKITRRSTIARIAKTLQQWKTEQETEDLAGVGAGRSLT